MRGTISLFVHQPRCSVQSLNGIIRALSPHYTFKIFTRHEVEDDFFHDVDMVCVPGGIGDSDSYDFLMKSHAQRIRNYLVAGGRYLGICMGAYWADTDYLGILSDIRAVQYIRQPDACTRRPHAKHMPVTWQGQPDHMYFYDGCAFTGTGDREVWARYANGDAMAIVQDRVGLIGCHPEADQHWYDSYSWMRRRWAGHRYGRLLEFVDSLMSK